MDNENFNRYFENADYIVTRNIKDFQNSVIKPILPDEFLKIV